MCGLDSTHSGYGPLAHYCAHSNYTAAAALRMLFIDYKRLRTNCSKNLSYVYNCIYMPVMLLIYSVFESGHICNRKTVSIILRI